MAQTNTRFAFSEVKVSAMGATTSLMKWQKIGPDNLPFQTAYIKRQFKGDDPFDGYRLPYIMANLEVEKAFALLETDPKGLKKRKLRIWNEFQALQTVLKEEYNRIEEREIQEKIAEMRRLPIK